MQVPVGDAFDLGKALPRRGRSLVAGLGAADHNSALTRRGGAAAAREMIEETDAIAPAGTVVGGRFARGAGLAPDHGPPQIAALLPGLTRYACPLDAKRDRRVSIPRRSEWVPRSAGRRTGCGAVLQQDRRAQLVPMKQAEGAFAVEIDDAQIVRFVQVPFMTTS